MTTLYRVLPWLDGARPGRPGHPLFVPGVAVGRIDNPDRYLALYFSDSPAGAAAEAFAFLPTWSDSMLRGMPGLPGSVQAMATLTLPDTHAVCDLDDAHRLVDFELRPSQVVTRDRTVTQRWALHIYEEERWAGVRWWSYHDPRWGSHGIWTTSEMTVLDTEPLTVDHEAVVEAAEVLNRPLVSPGS